MYSLNKEYIFIGMIQPHIATNRIRKPGYKVCDWGKGIKFKHLKGSYTNKQLRWVDGGMYFMRYETLKKMEDLYGCFTRASQNEKYQHRKHGIEYGEIEFPTRLHVLGFKFKGLTNNYELLRISTH